MLPAWGDLHLDGTSKYISNRSAGLETVLTDHFWGVTICIIPGSS